jgi:hypothetical protein
MMTLSVWLPCPHHYRHLMPPGFQPRTMAIGQTASPGGLTAPDREACGPTAPKRSDRLQNKGWRFDRHFRCSYHLPFCRTFIAYSTDFGCAPHDAYDTNHATHDPDIHDSNRVSHSASISGHATRNPGIPVLPTALLASPSVSAGAIDAASTSAFTGGEGQTSVACSQPSFDDHIDEVGLLATYR